MIMLLYGVAALILLWWLSQLFARSNPAALARSIKLAGGCLSLVAAALLMVRGRFDMAFLLGGVGAWLLGWGGLRLPGFAPRAKTAGSVSRVRSAVIEMELDHDSGQMDGSVLAGSLAGRRLNDLSEAALTRLHRECTQSDPEGVRLLEAYFDRRFPRWREYAHADQDTRTGAQPQPGAMTEEEAYQILGLEPGADTNEIRRAHRALMKKLHPDQGGSTYLATRVNQAKEILLGRHR